MCIRDRHYRPRALLADESSNRGQPYAIVAFGATGRPPTWGWAHAWLMAFRRLQALWGPYVSDVMDFLMPDLVGEIPTTIAGWATLRIVQRPMSYERALLLLRAVVRTPEIHGDSAWTSFPASGHPSLFEGDLPVMGPAAERPSLTGPIRDITDRSPRARAQTCMAGACLLYTSPSPRDRTRSRMPSSA